MVFLKAIAMCFSNGFPCEYSCMSFFLYTPNPLAHTHTVIAQSWFRESWSVGVHWGLLLLQTQRIGILALNSSWGMNPSRIPSARISGDSPKHGCDFTGRKRKATWDKNPPNPACLHEGSVIFMFNTPLDLMESWYFSGGVKLTFQ